VRRAQRNYSTLPRGMIPTFFFPVTIDPGFRLRSFFINLNQTAHLPICTKVWYSACLSMSLSIAWLKCRITQAGYLMQIASNTDKVCVHYLRIPFFIIPISGCLTYIPSAYT